jgi:hypothetical protein
MLLGGRGQWLSPRLVPGPRALLLVPPVAPIHATPTACRPRGTRIYLHMCASIHGRDRSTGTRGMRQSLGSDGKPMHLAPLEDPNLGL